MKNGKFAHKRIPGSLEKKEHSTRLDALEMRMWKVQAKREDRNEEKSRGQQAILEILRCLINS